MAKVFFSLADSEYKDIIAKKTNRRSTAEVIISAVLYFNIVTILGVSLAADGMSVNSVTLYLIVAYILILCSSASEIYSSGNVFGLVLTSLFEASAIVSAIIININDASQASPVFVVTSICAVTFLTLPISIRAFNLLIFNKGCIVIACIVYAFIYGDKTTKVVYIIFPLIIAFFIIIAINYWFYIRQVILLHQQTEATHLKNLIDEKNTSLEEARDKLKREHGIRDKMIRHISHDLRQPINTLNYSLFNLDKTTLNQSQSQKIDIAQKSIDTANYLIEDILQISTYQKHDIDVNLEFFRIQNLFDTLHREYQNIAELHEIKLVILPCSVVVHSDLRLISRIMRNFLSNAFRHSQTKIILIGARRRKGFVDIQVIDQGVGISVDQQAHLFEEFTSTENSKASDSFGLGLSIASNLAKACEAVVKIHANEGKGTTCTLRLRI